MGWELQKPPVVSITAAFAPLQPTQIFQPGAAIGRCWGPINLVASAPSTVFRADPAKLGGTNTNLPQAAPSGCIPSGSWHLTGQRMKSLGWINGIAQAKVTRGTHLSTE